MPGGKRIRIKETIAQHKIRKKNKKMALLLGYFYLPEESSIPSDTAFSRHLKVFLMNGLFRYNSLQYFKIAFR